LSTAGSASTWPKSGLTVASSVTFGVMPNQMPFHESSSLPSLVTAKPRFRVRVDVRLETERFYACRCSAPAGCHSHAAKSDASSSAGNAVEGDP
jgi:hypothetical protein